MFTANRVEWNGNYGLFITDGDDWNVTGNSFDRNFGAGLYALNMTAVAVTGNVFRRCGKGLFTPQVGLTISGLKYSVITGNTLYHGYMKEMMVDKGGHEQLVLRDNVGCPKQQ